MNSHSATEEAKYQRFYPHGGIRIDDGVTTDVGYTGQRLDATGLMHYQARYYDPLIGRFTTADTIVPDPSNPQDLNRYTYARNNPLKYIDPTGHWCVLGTNPNGSCRGSDAVAATGDLITDVAQVAQEAGSVVVGDVVQYWDRGWEYGEFTTDWLADRGRKLYQDPLQLLWDDISGTTVGDLAGGFLGTVVLGGDTDLTNCPDVATCVTGTGVLPSGKGAQAIGHTILARSDLTLRLANHEVQHVFDVEELGGVPMLAIYGVEWVYQFVSGGHTHDDISLEVRGDAAETGGRQRPFLPFPVPWNWIDWD